jgi:hypothetical protein
VSLRFSTIVAIAALSAAAPACKRAEPTPPSPASSSSPATFDPWAFDVHNPEWLTHAADRSASCAGVFRGTARINERAGHAETGADFDAHANAAVTLAWFMAANAKHASNQIPNEADERAYVDGLARDSESRFDTAAAQQTPESALENGRSLDACVRDLAWQWFMIDALRKERDREQSAAPSSPKGI